MLIVEPRAAGLAATGLQDLTLRVLYLGIRSLNVSEWFQSMHSQIVDAVAARTGAPASKLWITNLSYGVRIVFDALVTLPEVSSVNLGGVALLAK